MHTGYWMPELRIAGSRLYNDAACHFKERIFRNTASGLRRFLAFDEYADEYAYILL